MPPPGVVERRQQLRAPGTASSVCLQVLGADLTAYVAGADSAEELDAWLARPESADEQFGRRLAAAAEVVDVFATYNQVTAAAAWLRGVGPDGSVPATLIRYAAGSESAVKTLLVAAATQAGPR